MVSDRATRIRKACTLLRPGVPSPGGLWADLGCGDGIFTAALYVLIQPGGEIYAVDKDRHALQALERHFRESFPAASLSPVLADFTRPLTLPPLDGLLMANSLHFVADAGKALVLVRLSDLLRPGGRLIVVEYNTARANFAVPHPLDDAGFLALAREAGLHEPQLLAKIPSTFLGEMYSALAFKPSSKTA
jgi:ubiquinone/menaquinone biosynthesis C-methylase UbiE